MTVVQFQRYQEQTFDSFCKRLIRNESVNAMKELARRTRREVIFSSVPYDELYALSREDTYDLDEKTSISVGEDTVTINGKALAQAIFYLSPKLREVILLSFFLNMSDVEIADTLNVTPKTIRYRKKSGLNRLKELLEASDDEL